MVPHWDTSKARSLTLGIAASLLLAYPCAPALAQSATVSLTASSHTVTTGERFRIRLNVEAEGAPIETVQEPDLTAMNVVSRSTTQPMQFSFGFGGRQTIVQQSRVHEYIVTALRPGTLNLGPVEARVGGRSYRSQQIRIRVTGNAISPARTPASPAAPGDKPPPGAGAVEPPSTLDGATFDPEGFVRLVLDNESPYVGQQVTATIYLYTRTPIRSAPGVTQQPSTDGFWIQDLLPAQRTLEPHQQRVRGLNYSVYLIRRFAAFPLRTGQLTIGGLGLRVQTGHGFGFVRSGGVLERTGSPRTINVRELPTPAHAGAFVGEASVEARLDRTHVATGDAVTLTVGARVGAGNVRDIRFELPEIEDLRVLQPRYNDAITHPQDRVGGTRTTEWLIVPQAPGEYEIPAITLAIFNPVTEQWNMASTPALRLVAAGNAIPSTDAPPSAPPDGGLDVANEESEPDIEFGSVRSDSEFTRESTSISEAPWFAPSFAVGPLLLLLFWLGRRARGRAEAKRAENPERQGQREARGRHSAATRAAKAGDARKVYAHCSAALTLALDSRCSEPTGGLSRTQLRQLLEGDGVDSKDIDALVGAFEAWDSARFSPGSEGAEALRSTTEHCGRLLRLISRWSLTGESR